EVFRPFAANALAQIGQAARQPLLDAVSDPREPVRNAAMLAIPLSPDAGPLLHEALGHKQSVVRRRAVKLFGQLGPLSTDVAQTLARALEDEDDQVRANAADALETPGNVEPAREALRKALFSDHHHVRFKAFIILRNLNDRAVDQLTK